MSSEKANYNPGLCSIKGLEAWFRVLIIEFFYYELQVYNKFLVEHANGKCGCCAVVKVVTSE